MINLFVYAYPAQMITFQTITSDGEIINNENCTFKDTVRVASKHYRNKEIDITYVVGNTPFADKISGMIAKAFPNKKVERVG